MRFQSTILEPDGSTVTTEVEATDGQSLHERLHREGRALLRLVPIDAEKEHIDVALSPRRLLLLTQAMQEALDAGVPLLTVFDAIGQQEADAKIAWLLADIGSRVTSGQLLSDALAAHPRAFPRVYCALVRSGEQSGSLPVVLDSIAGFLEWRLEIAGVVRQALAYPAIVVTAGYAMVLFLLSFVVPRLGNVLSKIGNELPAASRALIGTSGFVAEHIVAIACGSVLAAITALLLLRVQRVRDVVVASAGRLPFVRGIVGTLAIAQFARTFGVLLRAGLTMPQALELGAAAVAEPGFRGALVATRERIIGGARLGEALDAEDVLPPVASSMVKVGEEAGRLPSTFERLGRLYDREVRAAVRRALGLLEPAVTILLGVVVGGVAVLVVTTIYTAMKGVGR